MEKKDKPLEERLIGVQRTLTAGTPVQYLKGVGPKTAEKFEKLGIYTLTDLLCHYPRRYVDYSKAYSPAEAPLNTDCIVKAEVYAKAGKRRISGGRTLERVTAGDETAALELSWFNNPYTAEKLEVGQTYYFQGMVTGTLLRKQMINPVVRTEAQVQDTPMLAVYPQTEGLGSAQIARCIAQTL